MLSRWNFVIEKENTEIQRNTSVVDAHFGIYLSHFHSVKCIIDENVRSWGQKKTERKSVGHDNSIVSFKNLFICSLYRW